MVYLAYFDHNYAAWLWNFLVVYKFTYTVLMADKKYYAVQILIFVRYLCIAVKCTQGKFDYDGYALNDTRNLTT